MKALTIEDMENLLQAATEFDEDIDQAWVYMAEDEQYSTFCQFFERDNFSHYDTFTGDRENIDYKKALKKILRGKDAVELILYALDFGRLVGRAEYTLKNN